MRRAAVSGQDQVRKCFRLPRQLGSCRSMYSHRRLCQALHPLLHCNRCNRWLQAPRRARSHSDTCTNSAGRALPRALPRVHVHDEIDRRRSPLTQPGAVPRTAALTTNQRHNCGRLRSLSSVHHYWHCGRGWHRRKHCRAGRLLARLRSRRRRRSRRRPAQAHPV